MVKGLGARVILSIVLTSDVPEHGQEVVLVEIAQLFGLPYQELAYVVQRNEMEKDYREEQKRHPHRNALHLHCHHWQTQQREHEHAHSRHQEEDHWQHNHKGQQQDHYDQIHYSPWSTSYLERSVVTRLLPIWKCVVEQ